MNKKKLLFLIPTLNSGGAEKSLLNLLDLLDYRKYEVDMIILSNSGTFLSFLNKNVNLVNANVFGYPFWENSKKKLKYLFMNRHFIIILRLMYFRIFKNYNTREIEQQNYTIIKNSIYNYKKSYDCAISYLENVSNYLCIDKVNARKKILWMHTDYVEAHLCKKIDEYYFQKADYLCTISNLCKQKLCSVFNQKIQEKIVVINNPLNVKKILKKSTEEMEKEFSEIKSLKIVTVARACESKGIHLVIETCIELKKIYNDFLWVFVGRLPKNIVDLNNKIKILGIEKNLLIVGEQTNPYKFMKWADMYVHPSLLEGKSIAIEEAKILNKKIILTPFDTAYSHIFDYSKAIISPTFNSVDLFNSILSMYQNDYDYELNSGYINNSYDKVIVDKFESLIDR